MAATETIRVRIDPETKELLTQLYKAKGITISQAIRGFLAEELKKEVSSLDRFDAIMASANHKIASTGEPTPTIDDINAYIDHIRTERREELSLAL